MNDNNEINGKTSLESNSNLSGYVFLFIGIFTWSTIEITLTLIKDEKTTPITINLIRMLIAGITLLIYIITTKRTKQFIAFIKLYPKHYIPAAIIGLVFGQLLYINGTQNTEPEIAAAIFSSNPLIISLYMMLFQSEERTKRKIFGLIMGFFGVLIIITEFNFDILTSSNIHGNILVFFGMSLWTVDVIIGKLVFNKVKEEQEKSENEAKYQYNFDSLDFNTITFLVAGISMIPLLIIPSERSAIKEFSLSGWLGILWLGVITGGLGYLFFFKGIQSMEASKGINAFYFKPIFATFLAFLIFNNIPTYIFWIGLIIEIFSLILVSKKNRRKQNQRKKYIEY